MDKAQDLVPTIVRNQLNIDLKDAYKLYTSSKESESRYDNEFIDILQAHYKGRGFQSSEIIKSLYFTFLKRPPSNQDIASWTNRIDTDGLYNFLKGIIMSEESRLAGVYSKLKGTILEIDNKLNPSIGIITLGKKYILAFHLLSLLRCLDTSNPLLVSQKQRNFIPYTQKKLYIDITHYYLHRHNTGIQRVVKNIYDSFTLKTVSRRIRGCQY